MRKGPDSDYDKRWLTSLFLKLLSQFIFGLYNIVIGKSSSVNNTTMTHTKTEQ
jgi:hypothetical protein